MEWFSGDIAEAVKTSKERNAIFVVYVHGKSDADSLAFNELLNNSEIAPKLSDPSRYLAVKIESDTDTYKQFVQIYRLVPVPSVFFIGNFGQPIEIVAGTVPNVDTFKERIAVAEGIFFKSPESPSPSTSSQTNKPVPAPKKNVEKPQPQETSPPQPSKEELAMQQLKEERRREKAADDEARRRVLEQIKMDRLRREPVAVSQTPAKPAEVATPKAPVAMPDTTRIQFRKPSGETLVDSFKSEGPFGDVWKYAVASVGIKDFVLATSMPPRKELSADHSQKTLVELNLAPSAVLLVIPLATPSRIGGAVAARGGPVAAFTNMLVTIFWTLVGPFLALWNRFRNGPPSGGSADQNEVSAGTSEGSFNVNSEISRKRNLARFNLGPQGATAGASSGEGSSSGAGGAAPKKRTTNSNVHRLSDLGDDDDENNTYNGNSTQQM